MSYFDAVQDAAARGESVRFLRLLEADFASETSRIWEGVGTLTTADGREWQGFGEVLTIGDLQQLNGGQSAATTITLEGVSAEAVKRATETETEAKGRPIRILAQFFDDEWQVLGNPLVVRTLIMDQVRYQMQGPNGRRLAISAENLLAKRRRVPYGRLTDADQKARHPGDDGLEYVAGLVNKVVTWPDF